MVDCTHTVPTTVINSTGIARQSDDCDYALIENKNGIGYRYSELKYLLMRRNSLSKPLLTILRGTEEIVKAAAPILGAMDRILGCHKAQGWACQNA